MAVTSGRVFSKSSRVEGGGNDTTGESGRPAGGRAVTTPRGGRRRRRRTEIPTDVGERAGHEPCARRPGGGRVSPRASCFIGGALASPSRVAIRHGTLVDATERRTTTGYQRLNQTAPMNAAIEAAISHQSGHYFGFGRRSVKNAASSLRVGSGGRSRDRTCDLSLVRAALSQLSYPPVAGLSRIRGRRSTCARVSADAL